MLSQEKVRTIEALLAKSKLSRREIARRVKVNRETVNRIASGQRLDYVFLRRRRAALEPRRLFSPIRCRICGAKIRVLPCQVCHVRRLINTGQIKGTLNWNGISQSFGLELKGECHTRYLAVLAAKIRRGEQPVNEFYRICEEREQGEQGMPLLDDNNYIRWFLTHVKTLSVLLELPDQLAGATSLGERWELLKQPGDIIVGVVEEFPIEPTSQAVSEKQLEEEVEALGIPWMQLMALLPILVKLIELVRENNGDGSTLFVASVR
jgi:hypothetical protein